MSVPGIDLINELRFQTRMATQAGSVLPKSDPRPTKKQRQVFDFVSRYISTHGYAPSYREIGTMVGIRSVSTVAKHIDGLVLKGLLEKNKYGARSLSVPGQKNKVAVVGQLEDSFEKQFVEQVESRLKQAEEECDTDALDDLKLLTQALKVLGFAGPIGLFNSRIDSLKKNSQERLSDTEPASKKSN